MGDPLARSPSQQPSFFVPSPWTWPMVIQIVSRSPAWNNHSAASRKLTTWWLGDPTKNLRDMYAVIKLAPVEILLHLWEGEHTYDVVIWWSEGRQITLLLFFAFPGQIDGKVDRPPPLTLSARSDNENLWPDYIDTCTHCTALWFCGGDCGLNWRSCAWNRRTSYLLQTIPTLRGRGINHHHSVGHFALLSKPKNFVWKLWVGIIQ